MTMKYILAILLMLMCFMAAEEMQQRTVIPDQVPETTINCD